MLPIGVVSLADLTVFLPFSKINVFASTVVSPTCLSPNFSDLLFFSLIISLTSF